MTAPPPSPALLGVLDNTGPVRGRAPARSLLIVALVACAYPAWTLVSSPLRAARGSLSLAWFAGVAALWFAGFAVPLAFAIVPRRGQVLPDGDRALRVALLAAAGLIGVSCFVPGFASSSFASPSRTWPGCLIASATLTAPTLLAGALVLRRVALVGSWRLGAALGAAGGALAGLTLHLTCANARPAHVALGHGGGIVLGAILGGLSFSLLRLRR